MFIEERMLNVLMYSVFPLYLLGARFRVFLYLGFAAQAGFLFIRGFELGRIPVVGVFDTLSFLSCSMIAFSLPVGKIFKDRNEFFYLLSVIACMFTAFSYLSAPFDKPLPPVLRTYWFELHVALSFFSYALFALSAIMGIVYLKSPDADVERVQYKSVLIGYSLFSLSMIFGGIWAYLAWGTYWLWTPKELWTSMLWLFYSFYLHARLRPWWQGKPSAMLGIAGFLITMFTYLGVGLLMKSSHSF